jgi:hypothetical protein
VSKKTIKLNGVETPIRGSANIFRKNGEKLPNTRVWIARHPNGHDVVEFMKTDKCPWGVTRRQMYALYGEYNVAAAQIYLVHAKPGDTVKSKYEKPFSQEELDKMFEGKQDLPIITSEEPQSEATPEGNG